MRRRQKLGLGFVFVWFFLGGIAHFVFHHTEMRIVPPYVPAHSAVVYISGVFELMGAFGILVESWRSRAGLGLFLLTIAVTPANIQMALHPARYGHLSPLLLDLRLAFQVVLLAIIWWSTRDRGEKVN